MISDDVGVRLHDRAIRGQPLTAEERNLLTEWYRRLDEEEARQFAEAQSASTPDETRDDIDKLLVQLALSAQRMRVLAAENDRLRCEIEELHRQLAQKRTAISV